MPREQALRGHWFHHIAMLAACSLTAVVTPRGEHSCPFTIQYHLRFVLRSICTARI